MIGNATDNYFAEAVLKKAIEIYGEQAQLMTACEELGELIQAISKYNRKGSAMKDSLTEEIADVMIMVWQIRIMAGIAEVDILVKMKEKIKRLKGRLEAQGGEK